MGLKNVPSVHTIFGLSVCSKNVSLNTDRGILPNISTIINETYQTKHDIHPVPELCIF